MKINRPTNKKTKLFIIIIISTLIVGVGLYTVYALAGQGSENEEKKYQSTEDQVKNIEPDAEPETKTEETIKDTNSDQPTPVTVNPDSNTRSLRMSVSADVSNSTLSIRGGIDNSVEFSGTCYAILSGPNGESVRKDTSLLQNASTTDCMTIQIPIRELAVGKWKITLNYSSADSAGVSNAFTVQI